MKFEELLKKYDVPVPRYTSYPTVPFWNSTINIPQWKRVFKNQFLQTNEKDGISLYIHLPFCESLCTYCGCNKKITKNHGVEEEYIKALIAEWSMYCELMDEVPVIRELHLGGGTPTFFNPDNLGKLLDAILDNSIVHADNNFSFEGHPNNTTEDHLITLYNRGFRRVSFGVQDNNPVVQKAINRIQPLENVKRVTEQARKVGFLSVNYDLIYGLPFQTIESIRKTVTDCIGLQPDRFAFYSYAHVPWTSKSQRLFSELDLPLADVKLSLYHEGAGLFREHHYQPIGMDHFVLATDDLYKAYRSGTLHRNFMGYTTQYTQLQLGLGVSAISDTGNAFAQNNKTLHEYYEIIKKGELPITKGCFLNQEDEIFKRHILDIICNGSTLFGNQYQEQLQKYSMPILEQLQNDGLVILSRRHVEVTETGKNFIRNICSAFDLKQLRSLTDQNRSVYSQAI
ncbi:MAG TPA: oxygen-independent coproporphyrinogen III oxidase [Puia sp.]|nr:oxygen-independent coproporphyrinogen III oxidase [Puia sp.]